MAEAAGISDNELIAGVVAKAAEALNLNDWKYTQEKFDSIGQNYFGVLIPVILYGKDNRREISYRLVLKLAPTDEKYRVSGAVTRMFTTEIFVYTKLLAEYTKRYSTFPKFVVPACYYVCEDYSKEAIVLQDMGEKGYKPYVPTFLDYAHIEVSLEALARFHAYSFILKKLNKKLYEQAEKVLVPLSYNSNKRYVDVMNERLCRAIEKFGNTPYEKIFLHLKQNLVKYIEDPSTVVEETIICHGDIWKENILFKYEDSVPVSACLIDFQTARVSSPAYDVLYLIASSTNQEFRQQHFNDVIELYYEEFDKVLEAADLETQEVYSRSAFERDLKTVAPSCLIVVNTAVWLASGLQEEGHVKSKIVLNTETEKNQAVESYKNRMQGLIDDFTNRKLISFDLNLM